MTTTEPERPDALQQFNVRRVHPREVWVLVRQQSVNAAATVVERVAET